MSFACPLIWLIKTDLCLNISSVVWYSIKFDKGWVKSFCPKAITIERYPYKGPFKSELEMKTVLANAKSD
jgi:hypothetical protein